MALTEIPIELSSTPSIVDGGNATAITIDSSENVTLAGTLGVTGPLGVGHTSGLMGYLYESTVDQNGSGKPSSVLGLAAHTNTIGEGPSLDFTSVWAGADAYQQETWNDGWTVARIAGVYAASGANTGALSFYTLGTSDATGGANHSALTEKMRLDYNGNVGIGTDSPGSMLHLKSTSAHIAQKIETTVSTGNATLSLLGHSVGDSVLYFGDNTDADVGSIFYDHSSNYMAFTTNTAERMRITSDGAVSIGTTATNGKLSIQGTGSYNSSGWGISSDLTIRSTEMSDSAYHSMLQLVAIRQSLSTGNAANGFLGFSTLDDSNNVGINDAARIAIVNEAPTSNTSAVAMSFWTNAGGSAGNAPTEKMRIDSSGNLLVGATSGSKHTISKSVASGGMLDIINSNGTAPSGTAFKFTGAAPNDGTSTFFTTADSSAYRGGWLSNGGIQNYQGNNSNLSDRREKTNFTPAKSYLDTICNIPVQTFNYIDQNMDDDDSVSLGVVAQDVQATAPELVVESNWGTEDEPKMRLSIYQTDFQYALMKCIQEQQTIIEDLKTRIETLEGE